MKYLLSVVALSLSSLSSVSFSNELDGGLAVDSDTLKMLMETRDKTKRNTTSFKIPERYLTSNRKDVIKPSYFARDVGHVINGVALRNKTSGTIAARGVPSGSKVFRAFLYWNFSDARREGLSSATALIDGNRVNGSKTADNGNICWSNAGNHTYKADVTEYIRPIRQNNDYAITLDFASTTSTTGYNPWSPVESQRVRVNGAWLVILYKNRNINKDVFIYDNLSDTDFSGTLNLALAHSPKFGQGLFSMGGADGQRGGGHNNVASNETSWFNGAQIAGPPVAMSDWDGSDGLPLPQLADTHTHQVSLNNGISNVKYVSGGDCLVPTVFVIEG